MLFLPQNGLVQAPKHRYDISIRDINGGKNIKNRTLFVMAAKIESFNEICRKRPWHLLQRVQDSGNEMVKALVKLECYVAMK